MDRSGIDNATKAGWRLRPSVLALLVCGACAARVPVPEVADHKGDTPVSVPYPPPAARAEMIPPQPNEASLWVDGFWMWKASAYSWNAGRWVNPGPDVAYARATYVRLGNGDLMFYAPKWTRRSEKD